MLVYTFDRTMDGVLTAVFDAYALRQQPEELVGEGSVLPLFCEEVHSVQTADDKAQRVWRGLETKLSKEALRMRRELEKVGTSQKTKSQRSTGLCGYCQTDLR